MSKLSELVDKPTVVDNNHESLYRSYWILHQIHDWLGRGMPAEIAVEMIDALLHWPKSDEAGH